MTDLGRILFILLFQRQSVKDLSKNSIYLSDVLLVVIKKCSNIFVFRIFRFIRKKYYGSDGFKGCTPYFTYHLHPKDVMQKSCYRSHVCSFRLIVSKWTVQMSVNLNYK